MLCANVAKSLKSLAGAGGFEPPNGGIKIRCLTTWLRPNAPSDCRGRPRAIRRRNIATPPSLINVAAKGRPKLVNSAYPERFESKDGNGIFSFLASKMCNSISAFRSGRTTPAATL